MDGNSFFSDQPISTKSKDSLCRREYAKKIAELIKLSPPAEGLMVSIEGAWGYGKTSLMNLVRKYYDDLKADEKPIIVNFNPWLIGNAENLIQEFLIQFASYVQKPQKIDGKKVGKELLAYSKVFDVVKFIPGAEPYASLVKGALENTGEAFQGVGKLKELNHEARLKSVIAEIKKLEKPIVVFIDDLDRLLPEECYCMLRLIKAVADFPNTTYILAFDPNYLENALASCKVADANKFLDKIIQLRLPLPKINETDLLAIFSNELEKYLLDENIMKFFEKEKEEFINICYLCIGPLVKSPREIKRILNRFKLLINLTLGEVSFTDLFVLQVLAIKVPSVYEDICSYPEKYIGRPQDFSTIESPKETVKEYTEERESILKEIDSLEQRYVKKILSKIFPLTQDMPTLMNSYYSEHKKVAISDRLLIAISYGLPSDEVSNSYISLYIEQPHERNSIHEKMIKEKKLDRFLELLLRELNFVTLLYEKEFLFSLGSMVIAIEEDNRKLAPSFGPLRSIFLIAKNILERWSKDKVFEVLKELILVDSYHTFSTDILTYCCKQHGLYSKGDICPESIRLCGAKQLEELKVLWIDSMSKLFQNRDLFKLADPASIVYLLRRINKEKAKDLIAIYLKKSKDMDLFFLIFKGGGQDVKGRFSWFDEGFIEDIGGRDFVRKKAKKRLDEGVKKIALKAIYKTILTGKSHYICDATQKDT